LRGAVAAVARCRWPVTLLRGAVVAVVGSLRLVVAIITSRGLVVAIITSRGLVATITSWSVLASWLVASWSVLASWLVASWSVLASWLVASVCVHGSESVILWPVAVATSRVDAVHVG